jgi:glycerophosphoryl diester phosphodiesterase
MTKIIEKASDGTLKTYDTFWKASSAASTLTPQDVAYWDGTSLTVVGQDSGTTPTPEPEPTPTTGVSPTWDEMKATGNVIIAHRGADWRFPDNAIYSMRHTAVYPELIIDADVQLGVNGVGLLHHDAADSTGKLLSTHTVESFKAYKRPWPSTSTWTPKPDVYGDTLTELLDLYGGKRVLSLEGKTQGATTLIINEVTRRGIQDRVLMTSFNMAQCAQIKAAGIPSMANFSGAPDIGACEANNLDGFIVYTAAVANDPEIFNKAHAVGLVVFVLQVTTAAKATEYRNKGADGFPTDYAFTLIGKPAPSDAELGLTSGGTTNPTPLPGTTTTYPLMGGCRYTPAEWETMVTDFDSKMTSHRTYGSGVPSSLTAAAFYPDIARKTASYWSVKVNCATFATDTAAHAAWSAFFDKVPADHRLNVIHWHEPEQEIARGDFTLAQWGAAGTKLAQIIRGKGRPNLRFGPCWMGPWTFDSRSPYYTWDWTVLDFSLVDFLGIDPYKINPGEPNLEQILTVPNYGSAPTNTAVLPTMHKLATFGGNKSLPVAITEWGCTQTNFSIADKALWIDRAALWMKAWNENTTPLTINGASVRRNRIEAAQYFNIDASQVVDVDPRMTWQLPPPEAPFTTYKKHVVAAFG